MKRIVLSCLVLPLVAATLASAGPALRYEVSGSIPGPDGRWDYAKIDAETRTLYVAHGNAVTAVDLAHANAVRSFGTIARAHAVVPIPGGKLLLVTSGGDDSVRLLDLTDGHDVAKIAVGANPDAAFYDAASGDAVVMNARSGTVSVIDVAAATVIRTITLKPGLEYGAMSKDGTLFVNNEDANEIETADLHTGKVGLPIAMPGCENPSGLGYDAKTERLVSACANGKAAVVDAHLRNFVGLLDIGKGPDAVIVDSMRRLAFVPCGRDGIVSVIALDALGGPRVTASVKTEPGARTGALDPSDGTLYLPTARFGPATTPNGRPPPLPGSFHVVVVSRRA